MNNPKSKTATAVAPKESAEGGDHFLVAAAKSPQERAQAYAILSAFEQAKALRKAANLIATTEWGAKLTEAGRAAFGRYCLELGGDPLRHVDVLGGSPFINGEYFRDVIAANPAFHHAEDPVWIHDDPRLVLCSWCGEKFEAAQPEHGHASESVSAENRRRMEQRLERAALRLEHNVPETDVAACIVQLVYSDGRGPFKGIGRARGGVHQKKASGGGSYEVASDPIGQASPRETAETRAWREAGEKAETVWFRNHPRLKEVEAQIHTLAEAGELREPEPEPPAAVALPPGEAIAPPREPLPEEPSAIENHNPTKACDKSGPHPRAECGYYQRA